MIKSAVITGATSMIGIHVIRQLLSQGAKVLAIARRKSKEIEEFLSNDNFKFVNCDLSDICRLDFTEKGYDFFIHLAWMGTTGKYRDDVYLQNLNVEYTLDSVCLAKRLRCKTFIGVGSQAEYGITKDIIKYDSPVNPETGYAIAKYSACKMSRLLSKQLKIRHIWVRIFSVYGPINNPNTLIMQSIASFLKGEVPKYTAGTQIWNYLYVEDAVKGILLAAEKGKDEQVYCIASTEQKKLKDYIYSIRDIIDSSLSLKFGEIPYSSNKVTNLNVDISREIKELGFKPEVSFEEGIKKTVKWYKDSN